MKTPIEIPGTFRETSRPGVWRADSEVFDVPTGIVARIRQINGKSYIEVDATQSLSGIIAVQSGHATTQQEAEAAAHDDAGVLAAWMTRTACVVTGEGKPYSGKKRYYVRPATHAELRAAFGEGEVQLAQAAA